MKLIDISTPSHPGVFAEVDDDDYERVSSIKWSVEVRKNVKYAIASVIKENGVHSTIRMHRFVLGAKRGQIVDHADRNGLNNQKRNLRFCTNSQNAANTEKRGGGFYSEYKGVSWCKRFRCWVATIRIGKSQKKLGNFDSEEAAAAHYDDAAMAEFGEFAVVNGIKMTAEMRAHRREFRRGELSEFCKITADDVKKIRSMERPQREIADAFGLSQSAVSAIKRRVTWKHVD